MSNRREISVRSGCDRSYYLHPHPYLLRITLHQHVGVAMAVLGYQVADQEAERRRHQQQQRR
jgi:hypothetical protein